MMFSGYMELSSLPRDIQGIIQDLVIPKKSRLEPCFNELKSTFIMMGKHLMYRDPVVVQHRNFNFLNNPLRRGPYLCGHVFVKYSIINWICMELFIYIHCFINRDIHLLLGVADKFRKIREINSHFYILKGQTI